jgi:predicted PurR-regulated permease PerM
MALLDDERVATAMWVGLGLALLALMALLSSVLTPFALGAVLAYLLVPGADWLQRHHVPRWAAALAMIVLTVLVLLGLVLILVPVLVRETGALWDEWPALIARLNTSVAPRLNEWFGWTISFDSRALTELLASHVNQQQDTLVASLLARLRSGGAFLLGTLGMLVLVPVVLFYLLVEWHQFIGRIEVVIPRRWHAQVVDMAVEIDTVLSQFLRGQVSVMVALALYYSVALALAGFQSALPIGVLTGMLAFVPYVGYTIGLVLALGAGLLQFDGWYGPSMVALVYGIGQVLEGFVLTPRLVGGRIGLHPLMVIFALLAFGQLFGFFGVLVALPSSAMLLVALRRLKRAYFESAFYGRL